MFIIYQLTRNVKRTTVPCAPLTNGLQVQPPAIKAFAKVQRPRKTLLRDLTL